MYNKRYGFGKKEKLCSRKVISLLFEKGNSFNEQPFRLVWTLNTDNIPFPAQTAISVGKKNIRQAVERNRIKRLIREAWRLNKDIIYNTLEKHKLQLYLMIIYSGPANIEYHDVEAGIKKLVNKFSLHLTTVSEKT